MTFHTMSVTDQTAPARPALRATGPVVVELQGDQDASVAHATRHTLVDAVNRAGRQPFLVVDLSQCTYIDASVLAALASTYVLLRRRPGSRLIVVIPETHSQIRRNLAVTSLDRRFHIALTQDDALAFCHDGRP
jgi:anti-anti-sigma factor